MSVRVVATIGVLVALLLAVVLVARRWWGEEPPPAPTAEVTSPSPDAQAPEPSSAGPRVEFAEPVATPVEETRPAAPRPRRTPAARRSGTAPTSVRITATQPELKAYFGDVAQEIGDRWQRPASAPRNAVEVPVVVKVARDGRILYTLVSGSSGDKAVDDAVARLIAAIERDGLPPIPDEYPYDEIDIGFVLIPAG